MIEQDSIVFGTTTIQYEITRSSRRKNACIAVHPGRDIKVAVPQEASLTEVRQIVRKRAPWVIKNLDFFDNIEMPGTGKEYVNGETFLYLGRQYRLKIIRTNDGPVAKLNGRYLQVFIPSSLPERERKSNVKKAVYDWYKKHAVERIGEITALYSKKLHIDTPKVQIKNQLKRWGSCTAKNMLIFNTKSIMAPASQLQYIVAHEICHIKYKDHSPNYWMQLRLMMPDYDKRKEALKNNGWKYEL